MTLQWLRSLVFTVLAALSMTILGIVFLLPAVVSRDAARLAARLHCRYVWWSARWLVGIEVEFRGPVPDGAVMIAAKHQSFLDILMLYGILPRAKFIMKRELVWTPVIGLYALRIGCVPVDRGKRGEAIRKMLDDVAKGAADPGQLVIYPEGTRVKPGAAPNYKIGAALLYEQLEQPCIPVATNAGLFWPPAGVLRRPGRAVIEFLPAIEPGLSRDAFLARLRGAIEPASNALMAEAGFDPKAGPRG